MWEVTSALHFWKCIVVSHHWFRSHLPESVVSLICRKLLRNGFERPRKTPQNWRGVDDDADADAAGDDDDVDSDDANDIDDTDNRDDDYDDNDDDDNNDDDE